MYANTINNFEIRELGTLKLTDCVRRVAKRNATQLQNHYRSDKKQLPKSWAVEKLILDLNTVCIDQHKTTAELSNNNCRLSRGGGGT